MLPLSTITRGYSVRVILRINSLSIPMLIKIQLSNYDHVGQQYKQIKDRNGLKTTIRTEKAKRYLKKIVVKNRIYCVFAATNREPQTMLAPNVFCLA
ncbi:MAG: hypothetical protein ABSB40_07800 [Nitrososphaeria archaeon]